MAKDTTTKRADPRMAARSLTRLRLTTTYMTAELPTLGQFQVRVRTCRCRELQTRRDDRPELRDQWVDSDGGLLAGIEPHSRTRCRRPGRCKVLAKTTSVIGVGLSGRQFRRGLARVARAGRGPCSDARSPGARW